MNESVYKTCKDIHNQLWRPIIHFTPRRGWMNDPCGLVWRDGRYHLFYQYNPEENVWGPMHWGHASSCDLLHWQDHPIALYPNREDGMAFTGSCVSLGSGKGIAAVFTGALSRSSNQDTLQRQCLALSKDGEQWKRCGVVLENPGIADFRDPKIQWHEESGHWIMVVTAGRAVHFYTSRNLREWQFESCFGEGLGLFDGIWECPDLIRLPVGDDEGGEKNCWVLISHVGADAGVPHAGSQYIIGDFDGHRFLPHDGQFYLVDQGHDFYAAQSWGSLVQDQQRQVWIAWAAHWSTVARMPDLPWRGTMTLPRELSLRQRNGTYCLTQQPVRELQKVKKAIAPNAGKGRYRVDPDTVYELLYPASMELEMILDYGLAGSIYIHQSSRAVGIDKRNCDMGPFSRNLDAFRTVSREGAPEDGEYARIVIDRSIIEAFFDGGALVFTELIFPLHRLEGIEIDIKHGRAEELILYSLGMEKDYQHHKEV